jgi:T-complex protein 1 subunit alpha
VSIVLRGANEFLLDEMDRALHDSLCVVQRALESKALVAGGGAVEAALSMYLDNYALTLGTKEQLAIKECVALRKLPPRNSVVIFVDIGLQVCGGAAGHP